MTASATDGSLTTPSVAGTEGIASLDGRRVYFASAVDPVARHGRRRPAAVAMRSAVTFRRPLSGWSGPGEAALEVGDSTSDAGPRDTPVKASITIGQGLPLLIQVVRKAVDPDYALARKKRVLRQRPGHVIYDGRIDAHLVEVGHVSQKLGQRVRANRGSAVQLGRAVQRAGLGKTPCDAALQLPCDLLGPEAERMAVLEYPLG